MVPVVEAGRGRNLARPCQFVLDPFAGAGMLLPHAVSLSKEAAIASLLDVSSPPSGRPLPGGRYPFGPRRKAGAQGMRLQRPFDTPRCQPNRNLQPGRYSPQLSS